MFFYTKIKKENFTQEINFYKMYRTRLCTNYWNVTEMVGGKCYSHFNSSINILYLGDVMLAFT